MTSMMDRCVERGSVRGICYDNEFRLSDDGIKDFYADDMQRNVYDDVTAFLYI